MYWIRLEWSHSPLPSRLADRVSDFQGREQTMSHTQQACKYVLPNLWNTLDTYFQGNLFSLAWAAAVNASLASAHPPHYCHNHLLNKKIQSQCSAQNPSVAPTGLVLFGGSGLLLRISGAQWTLAPEEKNVHTA